METIHDLRAELTAAGLGRPVAAKLLLKYAFLTAIALAFVVPALALPMPLAARVLLLLIGTWFQVSASMCGHDGSHQAASTNRWVNDLIAWLGFALLGGVSIGYWRAKHNLKHHPFCNVGSKDPDVIQWPFALSAEQHTRSWWLTRQFQKAQAWTFYPMIFVFMLPMMRWAGLVHAVRALFTGDRKLEAAIDVLFLGAHLGLVLGLPVAFGMSFPMALLLYALMTGVSGVYLTWIFAPAHMAADLVKEYHDPILLQLATTRNLRTNAFFRFTLIGLDHQIEHHLAAKMSHFDLPKAAPIVKAFCARNGLPYQESSWVRGILDTQIHLDRAWDMPEIVVGDPPLAKKQPAGVAAGALAAAG
jgi:fatty acid desaturase